ncbi:MAG: hypothetical protein GY863_22515 [bacterium]|nr:hypothetical protein [bacterium]
MQKISTFVEKSDAPFRIKQEDKLKIELPLSQYEEEEKLNAVLKFFHSLAY